MDIIVADPVTVTAAKLLRSFDFAANLRISSAVAPPPVKSTARKMHRRNNLRRKRRIKRKLSGDEFGNEGFFGDGGDSGGGFGGSGGGGWNFNNFGGGGDWDESSSSVPDPAFDFVYQVLSWIMLSNCLHFAFKRILQIILDADREKLPRRFTPIC
ncbi:hypothetical protein TanjilG_26543 [Lupinus angustifolius]|uniref:Uncharacterized protein n=1 Tax=Lupinus angustifolius TaxID=3871 RepID=A0A4P1QPM3_LUPAN|nr:PREDICTED: uncharacterized protein LOC109333687 [Lupinus angustifolius]OIV91690.1 hypothetical protein TanjilG_26543 [Lupinus angustifolius]